MMMMMMMMMTMMMMMMMMIIIICKIDFIEKRFCKVSFGSPKLH